LATAASRFWSVGASVSETVFDGGLRRAQTDFARAAYDATVATYRQTALSAFQGVEDNLAALRILEEEAGVQNEAVKAAEKSVVLTMDQYKAGTVSYLNVVTAQTIALTNETTAVQILGQRMTAAVLLVQALGGGWQKPPVDTPKAGEAPPPVEDVTFPVPELQRPAESYRWRSHSRLCRGARLSRAAAHPPRNN